jgi:hypothetical protein
VSFRAAQQDVRVVLVHRRDSAGEAIRRLSTTPRGLSSDCFFFRLRQRRGTGIRSDRQPPVLPPRIGPSKSLVFARREFPLRRYLLPRIIAARSADANSAIDGRPAQHENVVAGAGQNSWPKSILFYVMYYYFYATHNYLI